MVGIGKGAQEGILIKDAEGLELTRNINVLVLDKTGTITSGKPEVTNEKWLIHDDSLKSVLRSMENLSEHPIAEAVVNHLSSFNIVNTDHFESITGKGVIATINEKKYFVGNSDLLDDQKINIDEEHNKLASSWRSEAKTVIYFADDSNLIAILSISDTIKSSSSKAISELKGMGIEVYMLTGDNQQTAAAVSAAVGITNFKAGVKPQDKANFIKELQKEGQIVAMVGDGINDSAALAQADVSIAMGKGSDIAMDVAKMTIISSDLSKIPKAIRLSKHTVNTIRQNLFWAFIYNLIGIPIAAGILYPINGFLLNPMIAGGAMALSSVSVVSNSLLLKWKK
jgi:Cu2+-exporting ATPase